MGTDERSSRRDYIAMFLIGAAIAGVDRYFSDRSLVAVLAASLAAGVLCMLLFALFTWIGSTRNRRRP
jgi:hypothetical protein